MKALRRTLLGLAIAALLGFAAVYAASESQLLRRHEAPLVELRPGIATDPVEGRRLARLIGCWAGCHGLEGGGGKSQAEGLYVVTAPPLSSVLPQYSDAELVRLVRYGVKRDGRSTVGMASRTFYALGDAELAQIFAHLRAQPAAAPVARETNVTWKGRVGLLLGEWRVSADEVDRLRPRWGELPRTNAFERGRYLASTICSECHGMDFRGDAVEGGPSLVVSLAYSPEAFRTLMRTGMPPGGRDLGIMGWVARNAFVDFTDTEIEDIRTFLATTHARH